MSIRAEITKEPPLSFKLALSYLHDAQRFGIHIRRFEEVYPRWKVVPNPATSIGNGSGNINVVSRTAVPPNIPGYPQQKSAAYPSPDKSRVVYRQTKLLPHLSPHDYYLSGFNPLA